MKSFKQFLFEASKAQLTAMKNHFKSTEGLTDDQLNYYVEYWDNIISKLPDGTIKLLNDTLDPKEYKNIQNFIPSKKNPQPKLSFKDLEQLVDAHKGRQEYTGREKAQSSSSGEEDIIYNKNNLIIKKGHSRQSCITHGKGHTWCISRPDSSNLYTRYRFNPREKEPSFYFVYNKDKDPKKDMWFHVVIYVRNDGTYKVALAHNPGDEEMTWDEIVQHQPKLRGLEKLFKHIPLTAEEKELYNRFKDEISDEEFLKLNLKEMDFYISLGHKLSENVMLKMLKDRATKAILNNYVITQWLLPKNIFNKLTEGQRNKIEENQIEVMKHDGRWAIKEIINAGYEPSENVQIAAVEQNWRVINIITYAGYEPSEKVQLEAVEQDWEAIISIINAGYEPSENVQIAAVEQNWETIRDIIKAGYEPPYNVISLAIDKGWYDPPKNIYDKLSPKLKEKVEENQLASITKSPLSVSIDNIIKAGLEPSEAVQLAAVEKYGVKFIYDINNIYDSVIKFIIDDYDQGNISYFLSKKFNSQKTKQKLQAAFDKKYGK